MNCTVMLRASLCEYVRKYSEVQFPLTVRSSVTLKVTNTSEVSFLPPETCLTLYECESFTSLAT